MGEYDWRLVNGYGDWYERIEKYAVAKGIRLERVRTNGRSVLYRWPKEDTKLWPYDDHAKEHYIGDEEEGWSLFEGDPEEDRRELCDNRPWEVVKPQSQTFS